MTSNRFDHVMEELKTHRDEINVRMHLARADLRDEWEELEDKFSYAESKFKRLKKEGSEAADDVHKAFDVISEELGDAYKRIKDRLNKAS